MTESIARRTNAMANHRDGENMRKLLTAMLADIGSARAGLLYGFATYDTASLLDGAGVTTTIPVPGAVMGDFVMSVSAGVDMASVTMTGWVSANDVVSVRIQNESTGTVDLVSTTLRAIVLPAGNPAASIGMLCAAATYNLASLSDGAGATEVGIPCIGAVLGDYVLVSMGVDTQGIMVTGYVQAAGLIDIRYQNETGATIDLASTTVRVRVIPVLQTSKVPAIYNIPGVLTGATTFNYADGADGVGENKTITVTGALVGDFAIAGLAGDLAGITASCYVSAADTVTMRFQNESGSAPTIGSVAITATVIPQSVFPLTIPAQTTL
jgi:hypothetical protein